LEKWITLAKKGQTCKKGSHFEKYWVAYGKKEVTLVIMGYTRKNGSHLEKWATLGENGQTCKNGSHLEKWVTIGKMGHAWHDPFGAEFKFFMSP